PPERATSAKHAAASWGRENENRIAVSPPRRAAGTERAAVPKLRIRASIPGQRSAFGASVGRPRARDVMSRRSSTAAAHSAHSATWASKSRRSAASRPPSRYSEIDSVQRSLIAPLLSSAKMLAQDHSGAVQLRFRRTRRHAEQVRDLLVLEALDVVEHEHDPRAARQLPDRPLEIHPELG